MLDSVLDYQPRLAKQGEAEWLTAVVDVQAEFARNLARAYMNTSRTLLK
jgi:hypothetical protein